MRFHVRVPGKIMLAGEYGVLFGQPALSVATEPCMHLSLEVKPAIIGAEKITLISDLWPQKELYTWTTLSETLSSSTLSPFRDAVWKSFHHYKGYDFTFKVDASLNPHFGLGSSSALRLGIVTLGFIFSLYTPNITQDFLYFSRSILENKSHLAFLAWQQQQLAGIRASGYDFLTQASGGIVLSQFHSFFENEAQTPHEMSSCSQWLKHYEHLSSDTVLNCYQNFAHVFVHPHRGAPTVKTIRQMLSQMTAYERSKFGEEMGELTRVTQDFLSNGNSHYFSTLAAQCKKHRKLFHDFGTAPQCFLELEQLPQCGESWTFKTTGAGGDDAILFWGDELTISRYVEPILLGKGWQRISPPGPTHGLELIKDHP